MSGLQLVRRLVLSGCTAAVLAAGTVTGVAAGEGAAVPNGEERTFDVPPQSLQSALNAWSMVTGKDWGHIGTGLNSIETEGVSGDHTADEALTRILAGTGYTYNVVSSGDVSIVRVQATEPQAPPPPEPAEAADEREMDTIVVREVTAQRRAEELQEVPLAVSLFTEEDLNLRQISEPLRLIDYVPNLVGHRNTGLGTANTYFIRGLGNVEGIATFDPPVGTYVDEVYLARQLHNNVAFFDVEQVEVLRGPQGTLFGRNTTGGAVSIIMRKPAEELGGYLEAGYGRFDRYEVKGSVDVPVSDRLLTKASFFVAGDDGYVTNLATDEKLNGQEAWGLRGDVRVLFSDTVTWDLSGDFVRDDRAFVLHAIEGGSVLSLPSESGPRVSNTGISTKEGSGTLLEQLLAGQGLGNDVQSGQFTSNLEVGTDWGTLNVITGYRVLDQEFILDFLDGGLAGEQFPTGGFSIANDGEHIQFSQEIKFAGSFLNGYVDFVAGGFYFTEDNRTDFSDVFTIDIGFPLPLLLADRILENELVSYAAYAQMDVHPTERLTLTAGVRWTEEDKDIEYFDKRTGIDPEDRLDTVNLALNGIPTDQNTSLVTPRFAIEYEFTDNLRTFVSASKGFKSGGWNARGSTPDQLTAFGPEKIWSYEAGVRSEWFNRRLLFNVTGFYMDVEDFQIPTAVLDSGGSVVFLTGNFSDLRNSGVEIELTAEPVPDLNLYAALGYQHPEYTNLSPEVLAQQAACPFDPDQAGAGIITLDCEVAETTRTPEVTISAGASYTFGIPNTDAFLRPAVNFHYASEYFSGTSNPPNGFEDGYVLMNAGLTLGVNDRLSVLAECTNCTDEVYVATHFIGAYLNEPRRWMVRFRSRY
ncbi:MAG: TonB-dependent receptor domain-containing protein [Alphaproteobacteria bacterium]